MKYNTIKEAVEAWVGEMNAIPHTLLEKAYPNMDCDGLYELTPVHTKWQCDTCGEEFSNEEINELEKKEHYNIYGDYICHSCFMNETEIYNEEKEEDDDEFELNDCSAIIEKVEDEEYLEYGLPMWGWLWNPKLIDEWWIKENLDIVAECGFRIYECEEVGILLGIDGAGYDFYKSHWIPLYKARGLKWHKEGDNVEE